ncbi:MAG: tudor domain-containing protein [Promethearchaeota archaeon]
MWCFFIVKFKKGDKVFAQTPDKKVWLQGEIIALDMERGFRIRYIIDEWIRNKAIIQLDAAAESNKIEDFKKGDRILGNWKKRGEWYPGRIELIDLDEKRINVIYDDGYTEWIDDFTLLQKDKNYR